MSENWLTTAWRKWRIPKNRWVPASRWHELSVYGEYAYEAPGVILVATLNSDKNWEDLAACGWADRFDKPLDDAQIAFAEFCTSADCNGYYPDVLLRSRLKPEGSQFESAIVDECFLGVCWKHIAFDPPTHFMIVTVQGRHA